jgi:hypothetical protein
MADYVPPAWRAASSAEAYVEALLNSDDPDVDLAAVLEYFVGYALGAEPDADEQGHKQMRQRLKGSLVAGVERARTAHEHMDYEKAQLDKANYYLGVIEGIEKWIEDDFNKPKFTQRSQLEFSLEYVIDNWDNPYIIDPRVITPAFDHLKDRIRRRIKIAEKRFLLAGGSSNPGSDPQSRDEAAVRYGIGEMALRIMFTVPAWNIEKPTGLQLDRLAELAQELFRQSNLKSNLVRYYFDKAWDTLISRLETSPWFDVD